MIFILVVLKLKLAIKKKYSFYAQNVLKKKVRFYEKT